MPAKLPISRNSGITARSRLEITLTGSVASNDKAGFQPPNAPNPTTPAVAMATPMGTCSAISTNMPTRPNVAMRMGSMAACSA